MCIRDLEEREREKETKIERGGKMMKRKAGGKSRMMERINERDGGRNGENKKGQESEGEQEHRFTTDSSLAQALKTLENQTYSIK